tara:strand:+ start:185 stop:3190 length:3006 start_codon:yes stop_codon:yes gene_type:complete
MVQNRPHINKYTKELIEAVDKAKYNKSDLFDLIEEIELRNKAKNKLATTKIKAEKYLNDISKKEKEQVATWKKTKLQAPLKLNKKQDNEPPLKKSNTTLIYCYRPKIMARLFGSVPFEIHILQNSFIIKLRRNKYEVKLTELSDTYIKTNIFGKKLIIKNDKHAFKLKVFGHLEYTSIKYAFKFLNNLDELSIASKELEILLKQFSYINNKKILAWSEKHSISKILIKELMQTQCKLFGSSKDKYEVFANYDDLIEGHNKNYIVEQKNRWSSFFESLEVNPLTERQIDGILNDDDFTLIVAGAGTGKTSLVVGKIGFLIENEDAKSDEILALAYARDAASEMRQRVFERTGHKVEIRTFHSLARKIVLDAEGKVPIISDVATNEKVKHALISRLLVKMMEDNSLRKKIAEFISFHRYPAKFLEDFDSNGNYLEYLRKHEPYTLRGERVKSFEELLIADWLTLNGIKYSYEHAYEKDTSSRKRRQYKPDFYLVDYGIYLEHFGINKDGSTAPGINAKTYNASIEWKRDLHRENGTILIETFSWERMNGILLTGLEEKMLTHNIKITSMSNETLSELFSQRDINKKLISLFGNFLSVYKEGLWSFDEVIDLAQKSTVNNKERINKFLDIFRPFFNLYEQYLNERQEIDFSDLISLATNYLKEGLTFSKFTRVIIDEYQDISRGRQRLIKEIISQSDDVRLLCVGDDWQSIYGFTGSDIRMTTDFYNIFGKFTRVDLDRTFRFTDTILDTTSRFVQTNPGQFKKQMNAEPSKIAKSIEICLKPSRGNLDLTKCFNSIEVARPKDVRWSVLLLGRYKFSEPKHWKDIKKQFPMLDIKFMTIHKSKGLEADSVIILDLDKGRYGFPGEIPNDPLMSLVLPNEEDFVKAEERRVFYVAMTRARSKIIISGNQGSPSDFLTEVRKYDEISVMDGKNNFKAFLCPNCKVGHYNLEYPNRINGYAWQCSLHPYCDGKSKLCSCCLSSPLRNDMCLDLNCESNNSKSNYKQ